MYHLWRNLLVSTFLVSMTSLISYAEVDSKISLKFEESNQYWNDINKQIGRFLDIPFYFNVPFSAFSTLPDEIENSRSATSRYAPVLINYQATARRTRTQAPESMLGLRLIVVNNSADRKTNSYELANSGLFQAGDVVLSFRKEWYRTLRYSHIQLGVSHAGLLYIEKGADGRNYLKNLDMPLDDKHVGQGYLNSEHYLGAPLLHVVRARNLTEKQKQSLNNWIQKLAKVGPQAYRDGKIRFNQDYGAPKYKANEPLNFVGDIGRIALQIPNKEMITEYCSEFAWSVLSLRDCDPNDAATVAEFKKGGAPSCIKEIFAPMPLLGNITTDGIENTTVGLIDGVPLLASTLNARVNKAHRRNDAIDYLIRAAVFNKADGNAKNISSGHRSVEEAVLKNDPNFYEYLKNYYYSLNDEGAGQNPVVIGTRQAMNASQALNYSPTAFIVHGILPHEATVKAFDYIGTITYAPKYKGKDSYQLLRNVKVPEAK